MSYFCYYLLESQIFNQIYSLTIYNINNNIPNLELMKYCESWGYTYSDKTLIDEQNISLAHNLNRTLLDNSNKTLLDNSNRTLVDDSKKFNIEDIGSISLKDTLPKDTLPKEEELLPIEGQSLLSKDGYTLFLNESVFNINLERSLKFFMNIGQNLDYITFDDCDNYFIRNSSNITRDDIKREINNIKLSNDVILIKGFPWHDSP